MLVTAKRMGCPEHVDPREIVHAAFLKALEKPISERPSTANRKKMLAWLRTLVRYEIKTFRNSKHEKLLGAGHSDDEIEALLPASPGLGESLAAGEAWHMAMTTLAPKDRALVVAHYEHGKTVQEIAHEQDMPWSTVASRLLRIVQHLRARIVPAAITFLLLWAKKARAHVAAFTQQMPRQLVLVMHPATVVVVPVACGALLPTAASFPTDPVTPASLAWSTSGSSIPTLDGPVKPWTTEIVDPVKPNVVDTGKNPWSASDMNTNLLRRFVQGTVVPVTLAVAPAASASACAGTAGQTQTTPLEDPEKYDEIPDSYTVMCEDETHRGNKCPTREEWAKKLESFRHPN